MLGQANHLWAGLASPLGYRFDGYHPVFPRRKPGQFKVSSLVGPGLPQPMAVVNGLWIRDNSHSCSYEIPLAVTHGAFQLRTIRADDDVKLRAGLFLFQLQALFKYVVLPKARGLYVPTLF